MSCIAKIREAGRKAMMIVAGVGAVVVLASCAGGRWGMMGGGEREFTTLELGTIRGIGLDADDNLYVPDNTASTLYRVSTGGEVTVIPTAPIVSLFAVEIAADGTIYVIDAENSGAYRVEKGGVTRLAPESVTEVFLGVTTLDTDSKGNLYLGENDVNLVRKVTPEGRISVLAGTRGNRGAADGVGPAASFTRPRGLTVGPDDSVYVADEEEHVIRKITPQGRVTTIAGKAGEAGSADGTGSEARFSAPRGLAADDAGNVYVMDSANFTIRKITPAGVVTTLAGKAGESGFADGAAGEARFSGPRAAVVCGNGNLYVADDGNGAVRMVCPEGSVTTVIAASQP